MADSVLPASAIPGPRRPSVPRSGGAGASAGVRRWYEDVLGWPTAPGLPLRLVTGVRFDVLDVPAEAGARALGHLVPGSPVALRGGRMLLPVAAGSAEELPGLLDWLEWGAVALDLRALGAGALMEAPEPPGRTAGGDGLGGGAAGPGSVQGAAVWLRPPEPGREVEASLPALPAMGGAGDAPDLVRLVGTVAVQCHRVRLRRLSAAPGALGYEQCRARTADQPLAFS